MSDENGSNKSKYKQRKLMRMAGHAPKPRDPPKYYAEFMADFLLREKEQVEAARQGPLSTDPQRPWGSRRIPREQEAKLVAIVEASEAFDKGQKAAA